MVHKKKRPTSIFNKSLWSVSQENALFSINTAPSKSIKTKTVNIIIHSP